MQDKGKPLRILVQVESGEKHLVVTFEQDTVWQVKQKVFEVTDIMPHAQSLALNHKGKERELDSTRSLLKSKVRNGAQLVMRVRPAGDGSDVLALSLPQRSQSVAPGHPAAPPVSSPRLGAPQVSRGNDGAVALAALHAPSCFAFGTGLRQAVAGFPASFFVYLCDRDGVQLPAAEAVAEGLVEVAVSGTPADVALYSRPSDGLCMVTFTPYSASPQCTIDVRVGGASINDSPVSLAVRQLEGEPGAGLAKLLETPAWALAAVELLAHLAEESGDVDTLFAAGPLTPFAVLRTPSLSPLQRTRLMKELVRIYEALLAEDANKTRLLREHALDLCGTLLTTGVAHLSRPLHGFVSRFGAATGAPIASVVTQDDLLRVPAGLHDDAAWRRLFGQFVARVAPPGMTQALHLLISLLPGTETAALELIERMGLEGHWDAVLSVLPAVALVSRSLHLERAASSFLLGAIKRGGPAIVDRVRSSGLSSALMGAFALVDVTPLWEIHAVETFSGRVSAGAPPAAPDAAYRLLECAAALHDGKQPLSIKTLAVFFFLVRCADLKLALAAFDVVENAALQSEETCKHIVAAQGLGALSELAMRLDNGVGLRSPDHILALVAQVCRGASAPNTVEAPVIPWLVGRLRSTEGRNGAPPVTEAGRQAIIIVLIYFARIERYKARVVASGGFDFLSELIRMVRSENVAILRRISESEIELIKEIGSGACSRVWLGKWDHRQVAIKMFNENYSAFSEKEFGSELAIMSVLRHPNICHAFGGSEVPGHRFLVMPLFRRGSLLDIVRNDQIKLSMYRVLSMCLDSAIGMAFLHEAGILHRDLKTGNLLVDDNWRVAVVDFGISRMIDLSMSKKSVGTPIYSAPEILWGKSYSFSADVYSFAFVIWELVSREVPYKQHKQAFIINGVCNDNMRPPEPKDCPRALWLLIRQCWSQEPTDRPTFTSIVATLKRLKGNVGALNSLKEVGKDNRMTIQMAKTMRDSSGQREPEVKPVEGTKWATLGRNVPFPELGNSGNGVSAAPPAPAVDSRHSSGGDTDSQTINL